MLSTSLSVILNKSFERTGKILFKPFVLKKWLFLFLIAFLSGNLGGGCGNGNGGSWNRQEKKAEATPSHIRAALPDQDDPAATQPALSSTSSLSDESWGTSVRPSPEPEPNPFKDWRDWPTWAWVLILSGIFFALAFIILMSWLAARFQFVWFHAIVNDDASVIKPFEAYERPGNSLFKLNITLLTFSLLILAALGAWLFLPLSAHGVFENPDNLSFLGYAKIVAPPILTFILLVILGGIFTHLVSQFVVPIMAMDQCSFLTAWRKFADIYRRHTGDIWIYLITRFGLGIAGGIMIFIAAFMIIIVVGLAVALLGGGLYLVLGVWLKQKILLAILAIVLGIPLLAALILLLSITELPVAVFFRNFSLYYLSALDGGYQPLALPEPEGPA